MNQLKFNIYFLGLLFLSFVSPLKADEPLPLPSLKTICSLNKMFCAVLDPAKNMTIVYQAGKDGKRTEFWGMKGWFRVATLSNDGETLVTGYDGINLLRLDYKKNEVMLQFFKKGNLLKSVTLDQIIKDFSNLRRTVSHFDWGNYLGFNEKGYYGIETIENRKIYFDPTTGNPVKTDSPKPLPQYIGNATMTPDGTIILDLRAEDPSGAVGHGRFTYPPSHPEYQKILNHLGGLKPGEQKPVPAWGD